MDAINLIITVCAVLVAEQLRGKEPGRFPPTFSLQQCADGCAALYCAMDRRAPEWTAVKWRCEYPHSREKI